MAFRKVAILGVGLIGGSLGLALRARHPRMRITGYGRRPEMLQSAVRMGVIDESFTDPADAVRGADLVVLATPVGVFGAILKAIGSAIGAAAVVTDVGSTKASVVRLARRYLPDASRFVGSHPMAGSEKTSVEYARADLFDGATCIITPLPTSNAKAVRQVHAMWQGVGCRVVKLSPAKHDLEVGRVSHLPHLLASLLVTQQSPVSLGLAGKGFLDTTRIASGDGALWRDIILDNQPNLLRLLARSRREIGKLESLLRKGSGEEIRRWLDAAAATRGDVYRRLVSRGQE